jgi:Tfp pilus assembly protein PilF
VYAQSLKYEYTFYDDVALIQDNKDWFGDIHNLPKLFTTSVFRNDAANDNFYRPVLMLSFFTDTQLGGGILFRVTNILLHILCSIILFRLLLLFEINFQLSSALAFLFCIHPLNVSAIAWLPGRNDTLLALMVSASFLFFVKFRQGNLFRHGAFAAAFYIAALFTKESALLFFPMFVIYDFLYKKKYSFSYHASIIVSIVIYFLARQSVIHHLENPPAAFFIAAMFNNLPAIFIYLGKMIFPFNLSTYPTITDSTTLFGIIVVSLILIATYISFKKNYKAIYLFICWTIFTLAPVLIPSNDNIEMGLLEHRSYLPLMGFIILVAIVVNDIHQLNRFRIYAVSIFTFAFIYFNLRHAQNYKSEFDFYSNAVSTSPSSSFAHKGLGIYYQVQNKVEESKQQYNIALTLNPSIKEVRNNLARLYMNDGNMPQAMTLLKQELSINPNSYTACYNLASVYYQGNDFANAEIWYKKTLLINPTYIDAMNDYGALLASQKRIKEATMMFQKVIILNPNYTQATENLKLLQTISSQH